MFGFRIRRIKIRPWMATAAAFVFNMCFGCINAFGNLSVYVTSYLRSMGGKERLNFRYNDTHKIFCFEVVAVASSVCLSSWVQTNLGIKKCSILSGALLGLSYILAGLFCHSYLALVLFLGILFGLAEGLAFSCPLAATFKHYRINRGLVSGIVMAGTAISPLVFGNIQTLLINPDRKWPTSGEENSLERYFNDHTLLIRVPNALILLGIIYGFFTITSAYIFTSKTHRSYKPKKYNIQMSDSESSISSEDEVSVYNSAVENNELLGQYRLKGFIQLIGTSQFFFYWVIMTFVHIFVNYFAMFWKILILSKFPTINDFDISLYGNVVNSLANSFGRVFFGIIGDRYGLKSVIISTCISAYISIYMYIEASNVWGSLFFTGMIFFCMGGAFICFALIAVTLYDERDFSDNISALYTSRMVSAISTFILVHMRSHKGQIRLCKDMMITLAIAIIGCNIARPDVYKRKKIE